MRRRPACSPALPPGPAAAKMAYLSSGCAAECPPNTRRARPHASLHISESLAGRMAQLPALAELEPLQRLVGRPSTGPELDIHVDQQKAENIHSPSGWGQTEFFFLCALFQYEARDKARWDHQLRMLSGWRGESGGGNVVSKQVRLKLPGACAPRVWRRPRCPGARDAFKQPPLMGERGGAHVVVGRHV